MKTALRMRPRDHALSDISEISASSADVTKRKEELKGRFRLTKRRGART